MGFSYRTAGLFFIINKIAAISTYYFRVILEIIAGSVKLNLWKE